MQFCSTIIYLCTKHTPLSVRLVSYLTTLEQMTSELVAVENNVRALEADLLATNEEISKTKKTNVW